MTDFSNAMEELNCKNISNAKEKVNKETNKKIYIEILRCIAIIFVVFNHTGTNGFQHYTTTDNSILYIIYLLMAIICRIAVPIFFMISGALLLNKEEDIKTLYKKRIFRIVIVILIASFVQYLYSIRKDFTDFNIIIFFKTIYTKNITIPYWYLYSYLIFLIMLPFLRNLVKNMKIEQYYYLFAICVVYKIIMPIITQTLDIKISSYLQIVLLETNIIYPIIGHFCENVFDIKKINKKMILFTTIILLIILAIGVTLTMSEIQQTGNKQVQTYLSYGSLFIAMYTYIALKYLCDRIQINKWISKLIIMIGGCSFGVYLMEEILRRTLMYRVINKLTPFIKTMPACIIGVISVVGVGAVITIMLKQIPYVKKLL